MKVTNQHFIEKAVLNTDKKRIFLQFNFPPDIKYLHITNIAILHNNEVVDNIFGGKTARVYCITESGKFSGIPLDRIPPTGSVFRVRIKNSKTQDYEDTSFSFDGKCFHKLVPKGK